MVALGWRHPDSGTARVKCSAVVLWRINSQRVRFEAVI